MRSVLLLLFLSIALPSFVFGLGGLVEPRYFDLTPPLSEGTDHISHPWRLDFGQVSSLTVAQQQDNSFAALRLEPTKPHAQLTYDSIHDRDSWMFISAQVTLSPTEENIEFFDFCGALVSFRATEDGGRLGFLSKAPGSEEWAWFELDQTVGQAIENSDSTTLDLQFAIHRSSGRWALGVDDLAFPNLDLVLDPETGEPENSLYILGFDKRALYITGVRIVEISALALQDSLDDQRLRRLIPEDTEFFIEEGIIKVERFTEEKPHERLRVLYLRGFTHNILDQDQKLMEQIDGGELGPLVIYGSVGPTPSFLEVILDAEYTDPSDLKFIKWELYASDDLEKNYTLLRAGRFDSGVLEKIISLREGESDPPVSLSLRVFLDF